MVKVRTAKINAGENLAIYKRPSGCRELEGGRGVEIPLVASCYAGDKHLPDEQLSRGLNFTSSHKWQ